MRMIGNMRNRIRNLREGFVLDKIVIHGIRTDYHLRRPENKKPKTQ